jgi:DNA polymerase
MEYILSPKFHAFGAGVMVDGEAPVWIAAEDFPAYCKSVDWKRVRLIAHNAKFDAAILAWKYWCRPAEYVCTQAMARAVYGATIPSYSLSALASVERPKGMLKTDGLYKLTPQQMTELADYCKNDVQICWDLYKRLGKDFPSIQLGIFSWHIRCFVEPELRLDRDVLDVAYADERDRRSNVINLSGVEKTVLSSNKKFAELLRKRGYEVPMKPSPTLAKRGERGQIPAFGKNDGGFLELLHSENSELRTICEARLAAKSVMLESRVSRFLDISGFNIYPFDIDASGAKQTHRAAGANRAGGNPQNLMKGSALRKAVVTRDGQLLVVGDFGSVEARIVAYLAGEQKLISLFESGGDPYCDFASIIYGRIITPKDEIERRVGKICILGLGYGMGPKKFRSQIRIEAGIIISQERAEEIVGQYRSYYDKIPAMWKKLDYILTSMVMGQPVFSGRGLVKFIRGGFMLPSGLVCRYSNVHRMDTGEVRPKIVYDFYNKARKEPRFIYGGKFLENISQALAGEICRSAITRAEAAGLRCVGQVHDEILVVGSAEAALENAAKLKRVMETSPAFWREIKLTAEVGVGSNWLDAKKNVIK